LKKRKKYKKKNKQTNNATMDEKKEKNNDINISCKRMIFKCGNIFDEIESQFFNRTRTKNKTTKHYRMVVHDVPLVLVAVVAVLPTIVADPQIVA
jgi:hypothetical protein